MAQQIYLDSTVQQDSPSVGVSPTRRGLVLMRLLVPGAAQRTVSLPAGVLRCAPRSAARG